ncbi:hypothetical protein ABZU75_38995 [Streptosporangium sp. NPDC005286]
MNRGLSGAVSTSGNGKNPSGLTLDEWNTFVSSVKDGEFDMPR